MTKNKDRKKSDTVLYEYMYIYAKNKYHDSKPFSETHMQKKMKDGGKMLYKILDMFCIYNMLMRYLEINTFVENY